MIVLILFVAIYWTYSDTRIYNVGSINSKIIGNNKYYVVSNPPRDKLELLNILSEFINKNEYQNLNYQHYYKFYKETKKLNRFYKYYSFLVNWEVDEDLYFDNYLHTFCFNDLFKTDASKNYFQLPTTNENDSTINTFYYPFGYKNNKKIHWTRIFYVKNKLVKIDSVFIPKEIINFPSKYKYLR